MLMQFKDVPFAVEQTAEIAGRCFYPNLERDVLLPNFPIPRPFTTQNEYLEHLVFTGAKNGMARLIHNWKPACNLSYRLLRK